MFEIERQYCKSILPRVSRTFAPTIRMLPGRLETPVTAAYLLCRIADTVEDNRFISVELKKEMLGWFVLTFDPRQRDEALALFLKHVHFLGFQNADDELTFNLPTVLRVFDSFSNPVRHHISRWVIEMSRGMQKYAQSSRRLKFSFLQNMQELDEYMYYVAGTVGYLLTGLFSHYSQKITPVLKKRLELLAESFGKGLQLVNIIRDMSGDLRRGQSYIPDELLLKYKLTRQSVFEHHNEYLAVQMFEELIERALGYLDKAIDYILLIPKEEGRIRLFCILPVFWAMRTLQKIRENTQALLNPEKVKIPRSVIRREYFMALLNLNSNRLIRYRYDKIRAAIARVDPYPAMA